SGSRSVVTDRSASVMIQSLSPVFSRYADNRRKPSRSDSSFSFRSCSSSSPQSPEACRYRNSKLASPDSSRARNAPGVATICPKENFGDAIAVLPAAQKAVDSIDDLFAFASQQSSVGRRCYYADSAGSLSRFGDKSAAVPVSETNSHSGSQFFSRTSIRP